MGSCIKKQKSLKEHKAPSFVPLEQAPENPEIVSDLIPEPVEVHPDNYPEFFTNVGVSGLWTYNFEENDIQFSQDHQQVIETSFLMGKPQCEILLDDVVHVIIFKENLMKNSQEMVYPVNRMNLTNEIYGWKADDQTIRPLLKDVVEMLELTQGKLLFKIDGVPFSIDLGNELIMEMNTRIQRKIEFL